MVISIQGLCFVIIVFSSVKCQTSSIELESIKNQELNKTIQEFDNIPRANSQLSSKPFLPFSNVGAPAGPSKLSKEQDQVAKSTKLSRKEDQVTKSILHSIHKGIYTTLDKLPLKKSKTGLKKLIGENLGGLSPDEIYYIDKDLLIIKGGDFEGKKYFKKYGRRRKNAKRTRRIKSNTHKTSPGLRFTPTNEENSDNTSSEEVEDPNSLPLSSIPTSELSLFLPSFQVQSNQQKQASTFHYFHMPPPALDVVQEHFNILPHLLNDHYYPYPVNFHSYINYQDDFEHHPHFDRNNGALYANWLPAPLKVAHSYFGDTDINYKFPKTLPNPDASWISLKSNLK